jgi:hypothetical protein
MAKARTKYFNDVPCEICGVAVKPQERLRKGKFNGMWRAQKFCSRACANKGRVKKIWLDKAGYPQMTTPDGRKMAIHRYVMEEKLCRRLLPTETVHHKDGDRKNYDESNLELWASRHGRGQRVSDLTIPPWKLGAAYLAGVLAAKASILVSRWKD